MGAWFSKVMHALSGQPSPRDAARHALEAAQRERAKIALEVISANQPLTLTTIVEQVRGDDIVIDQPIVGGHTYPLAFGEQVKMSFTHQSMNLAGASQCMGRVKIPSGGTGEGRAGAGDGVIFAYRLALPESLALVEHDTPPRSSVPYPIPAQLHAPDSSHEAMPGEIVELTMTGARLHTAFPAGRIGLGQSFNLKAELPAPVGLVDQLVDIVKAEPHAGGGQLIAVDFRGRVPGLETLIGSDAQAVHPQRRIA